MNQRSEQAAAAAEARAAGRRPPSTTAARTTTSTNAAAAGAGSSSSGTTTLSDTQQMELMKYAFMGIGMIIVAKILVSSLLMLSLALLPIIYLYGVQTCPSISSFEAKRELKRVLRGYHLPDTHPDKPRGYFEGLAARVAASVTTELATLPGYEVSMINLLGAGFLVTVTVPTAKMECYWIGAFGRWYYIYSRELGGDGGTGTTPAGRQ